MALLDVNVLVALVWDSHVHHAAARAWFEGAAADGWATCPMTEAGFVRVSSNPKVLPSPVSVVDAVAVLAQLRRLAGHRFLADDVSPTDGDMPSLSGYRQVTDAHLLMLARRRDVPLVTFDVGLVALAGRAGGVELLTALDGS